MGLRSRVVGVPSIELRNRDTGLFRLAEPAATGGFRRSLNLWLLLYSSERLRATNVPPGGRLPAADASLRSVCQCVGRGPLSSDSHFHQNRSAMIAIITRKSWFIARTVLGAIIITSSMIGCAGDGGVWRTDAGSATAETSSPPAATPPVTTTGEHAAAVTVTSDQPTFGGSMGEHAAKPGTTTSPSHAGRVIAGPGNIRSFSPENKATHVDAATLDLALVFEDLGQDARLWYQHVQTLANPYFEGRAPGTEGIKAAADYIEFYYRQCELEPAFVGETEVNDELGGGAPTAAWTSYRQPFFFGMPGMPSTVKKAEASFNDQPLVDGEQFVVLGNSASLELSAPITFVGYGIDSGQDGYTSFDDQTNLAGRIAMVLRYEPLNDEGKSRWSLDRFSSHAGIGPKLQNLQKRGAAGIIMVNPPGAVDGQEGLEPLERSSRFGQSLEIPAIQVTSEVADQILNQADPDGRDLMTLRKLADNGEVKTIDFRNDVHVSMAVEIDQGGYDTENVGGVLRGKGTLADEWLVVGAHYDHVGYGYTGSRPDNRGMLHPGADDNASGTSALLIIADRLSDAYKKAGDDANLRSIIFIAFSAEEAGLHGSRHYVNNPTVPLESIDMMFNMDMVGRLRSDELSVSGTGTAAEFDEILTPHFTSSGLTVATSPGGFGPSDHASFFGEGIPVLFFFTGLHPEYHTPADLSHTVNPAGAAKVIDLGEHIIMDLATREKSLTFVNASTADPQRNTGARVRLGVMPAYGEEVEAGVLIDQVFENSAAYEAGIRKGDVLLTWNGESLNDGAALMEKLRSHEPGDVVKLGIKRGEGSLTFDVTLRGRDRQPRD